MCYMESKMQEQIEHGILLMDELGKEFELFSEWFLTLPDVDETLIDIKYLNERFQLHSPSDTASTLWVGWRASKGL